MNNKLNPNIKTTLKYVIASLFTVLFTSCEEVINIDLQDTEPRTVIEAVITDQPGPYIVKLSKSGDYFVPSEYPTISDALIQIADNAGNTEILIETEPGIYLTNTLSGTPGNSYSISITIEDVTYFAQSTMPQPVEIDSLSYEISENMGPGQNLETNYILHCYFQDRMETEDFYRFKVYRNDVLDENIILFKDEFTNGNSIDFEIHRVDSLQINDLITVELLTLNEQNYNYFSSLSDALATGGGFMSDAPANPESNIDNEALGYFGAFPIRSAIIELSD